MPTRKGGRDEEEEEEGNEPPRNFQALRKYWYQKLKESGFEDAETIHGYLKDFPSQRLQRDYSRPKFEEKQDYYRHASFFLHDHSFDSPQEKKIWELHTNGFSTRGIAKKLRTSENTVNKDNVQKVTSKLSKIVWSKLMHREEEPSFE